MTVDGSENQTAVQAFNIVIAGGGFSGAMVAVNLLRLYKEQGATLCRPVTITLVDESGRLPRGVAYSTDSPLHLLNVPAFDMSALPDQPDHFIDWLRGRNLEERYARSFVPRMIFGDYLSDLLGEAVALKDGSIEITMVEDQAVAFDPETGRVALSSSASIQADALVLAIGNFAPSKKFAENLSRKDLYINDPWSRDALVNLDQINSVFLIGTGLTMVDLVVQLHSSGYQGQITAVSRHGLLPSAHPLIDQFDGARYRGNSFQFAMEELPASLNQLFTAVRQNCRPEESGADRNWRQTINALRSTTQARWKRFTLADKRRFLRHVRPIWDILRHRMAPEIAATVSALQKSGQLKVLAGRIQMVEEQEGRLKVSVKLRGGGQNSASESFSVDRMINCSGPDVDLRTTTDPLLKSLIDSGTVQPHELAMGLKTEEGGLVAPSPRADVSITNTGLIPVYAIGSLRKGDLWESVAVPELRVQAREIARLLLEGAQRPGASVEAGSTTDDANSAKNSKNAKPGSSCESQTVTHFT